MAIKYLKKAIKTPSTDDLKTRSAVQNILDDIEKRREEGIKEITKKFDKYEGEIVVSKEKIEEAIKKVDQKIKDDVQFAHERIKRFAEHQLKSMNNNFEVELSKGLFAGQRLIPIYTGLLYSWWALRSHFIGGDGNHSSKSSWRKNDYLRKSTKR